MPTCESFDKGLRGHVSNWWYRLPLGRDWGLSSVQEDFSLRLLISIFLEWLEPFTKLVFFVCLSLLFKWKRWEAMSSAKSVSCGFSQPCSQLGGSGTGRGGGGFAVRWQSRLTVFLSLWVLLFGSTMGPWYETWEWTESELLEFQTERTVLANQEDTSLYWHSCRQPGELPL